MERPTGVRNRLVALSAVLAFALVVTGVAVVAGSGGDQAKLEKLSFAAGGGTEATSAAMATGAPSADYPDFGPVEYRVKGDLPELADKAPAYRLAADATKDDVAKLAAILGLTGEVSENGDGGWSVRSGGQELNVRRGPGLPWFLSTACTESSGVSAGGGETVVSSGCVSGQASPMMAHPAMASGAPMPATAPPPPAPPTSSPSPCRGGTVECQPAATQETPTTTILACAPGTRCVYPDHEQPPMPPRDPDLPSSAEAERIARGLFAKLGVDIDGVNVQMYDGFQGWRASIEPRVGGLPTLGRGTSMAIGPKGRITGAIGFLAEPDRIGDYPLVGTAKALERLRAGKGFGPGYRGGPRPLGAVAAPATAVARPVETAVARPADEPATGNADCLKPTVICDPPPPFPEPPIPVTTTVPCPPEAGCVVPSSPRGPQASPVPPAPAQPLVLTITGVHLALEQVGPALVPVYLFELEGAGPGSSAPPVPAVTDEWIAANLPATPQEPGTPEGKPLPVPMSAPAPMPAPPTRAVPMGAPSQVGGPPAAGR